MAELRLNTYFLVPPSAINTEINLPYFAYDNGGIQHYTMAEKQTLSIKYLDPASVIEVEPCLNYTDHLNYTINEIGDIFDTTDFPRNGDGYIEFVIFPQTMHPSVFKNFINEMKNTLGYSSYSDDLQFDWDSIDELLKYKI